MDKGWIKLHRKLKKHWVWESPLHLKIWLDFLFRANFTDNKIAIDSRLEHIKIGQFITSLKKLAIEYHCSVGKIRGFIKLLEKDSMIELKATNKFTRITICNYSSYQDEQQTERFQNENRMKTERFQNDTVKKDKKEKKEKNDEEGRIPAKKQPDFITQILNLFCEAYLEIRDEEFIVANKGKERNGCSKLLIEYKKKNPEADSAKTLSDFKMFYERCLRIDDNFHSLKMAPMWIASNINEIRTLTKGKINGIKQGFADGERDRLVQQIIDDPRYK